MYGGDLGDWERRICGTWNQVHEIRSHVGWYMHITSGGGEEERLIDIYTASPCGAHVEYLAYPVISG